MSRMRKLSILQWFGLFAAPWIWIAQHGMGQGAAFASCSVAGRRWGVSNDAYQIVLMIVAGIVILAAEAASLYVVRETSDVTHDDGPPAGRIRMIAVATAATNFLFLGIILLDGIASVLAIGCRNS